MARLTVYLGIVLLLILHYDFWLWGDPTLVSGFLPVGLAYHMGYSLATAALWYLASECAWPDDAVNFAESPDEPADDGP